MTGLEAADLERTGFMAAPLPLREAALEGERRLAVGDDWPIGGFKVSGGRSKALRMVSTAAGMGMA